MLTDLDLMINRRIKVQSMSSKSLQLCSPYKLNLAWSVKCILISKSNTLTPII
jgi:hypothetical protein